MKEPHMEGVATHHDPESCGGDREGAAEALSRGTHRRGIELRKHPSTSALTLWTDGEGNTSRGAIASRSAALRSRRPTACVETPCARTGRSRGLPPDMEPVGRGEKARSRSHR